MRYLSKSELSLPFYPFGDGREYPAACLDGTPLDCIQELPADGLFPSELAVSAMKAVSSGNAEIAADCISGWKRFLRTRLSVTGGVTNDIRKDRTCRARQAAAVFFLARAMLLLTGKAICADVMDLAVNNDLWAAPEDPLCSFVRAFLPETLLCAEDDRLYINLFSECTARISADRGQAAFKLHTDYPLTGNIYIETEQTYPGFSLALRLPEWVKTYSLTVNGHSARTVMDDGYLTVEQLRPGDRIEYSISIRPALIFANPRQASLNNRAALGVGPVVYCRKSNDADPFHWSGLSERCRIPSVWDEYELYAGRVLPDINGIPDGFIPCRLCQDGEIWFPFT